MITSGKKDIWKDLTITVPTVGNINGIRILIGSIVSNNVLPAEIKLVCDGKSFFGDFYLEQLADLLKYYGVRFTIENNPGTGEKKASDRCLDGCNTQYVLMLHDDVWCSPKLIEKYAEAVKLTECLNAAAIVGSKVDVNNIRNYSDYDLQPHKLPDTSENIETYFIYEIEEWRVYPVKNLDTGNILFDASIMKENKIRFCNFNDNAENETAGHEFLLPMNIKSKGCQIFFCPEAFAFHLEKPTGCRHSSLKTSVALAKREAQIMGLKTDSMDNYKGVK